MKKWTIIGSVVELISGVCTVIGLVAAWKTSEDLDDQIRRVIKEEQNNEKPDES